MISRIERPALNIDGLEEFKDAVTKETPAWLTQERFNGISRFQQLGIPTVKDEEWKYTNFSSLKNIKFRIPAQHDVTELNDLKHYLDDSFIKIVFINGVFSEKYSNLRQLPDGLLILNLKDAFIKNDKTVTTAFLKLSEQSEDAFASLNRAFFHHGALIKIEDKAQIKNIIHIIHVTSGADDNLITFPRSLICLGRSSEADIIESHICFSDKVYFSNSVSDILMSENSILRYYSVQDESKNAYHVANTRIWQERDSQSESFSLSLGAKISRNNLAVILGAEGASAVLNGLYAIDSIQHIDNHTSVEHRVAHCVSNQLYKGVLYGKSHAVFNGKIFVRKEAQQTNSYQLNKNLLLGDGCQVDTKPQLEIFADDVRCTHGATIGQLDEDEIFYLRSRCISKELAVKMLSRGFVDDILARIKIPDVRAKLDGLLTRIFPVFK